MIEGIYYTSVLMYATYTLYNLLSTKRYVEKAIRIDELSKIEKETSWYDLSDEYRTLLNGVLITAPLTLGIPFIGMFTSSWIIWCFSLGYSILVGQTVYKWLNKSSKLYYVLIKIQLFVNLILSVFIVINKYHLHINIFEQIKTLF